jgi:hypothetical protein
VPEPAALQKQNEQTRTPAPSPAVLQQQIEQTRSELAVTIDLIADKVSPKRVAGRGVGAVMAKVDELRSGKPQGDHAAAGPTVRWERVGAAGAVVALLLVIRAVRHRGD